MVSRRSFLMKSAPGAALASAVVLDNKSAATAAGPESVPPQVFELVTVRAHFVHVNRMLGWSEKRALPLFQKHRFGPMGYFMVEVGPHIPALVVIRSHASLSEFEATWRRVVADPDWDAALVDLEAEGAVFDREDYSLLVATRFSPLLEPTPAQEPAHKIFELRIYESSTHKQHGFMHDRFAGGEIEIFHKCGIRPILYADTVFGPSRFNMVYLTPFESEAHREKAWAAFRESPEWKKLSEEFLRKSGELARKIGNMILTPTSFSMIR